MIEQELDKVQKSRIASGQGINAYYLKKAKTETRPGTKLKAFLMSATKYSSK